MKVMFVSEVLGLARLQYALKNEDSVQYKNYMEELLNNGFLEDVSELFNKEDRELLINYPGFLAKEDNFYMIPEQTELSRKMRTDSKSVAIIEKYNKLVKNPMNIQFRDISEEEYERMIVVSNEDGSESVVLYEQFEG